jgi:hypothetical protein
VTTKAERERQRYLAELALRLSPSPEQLIDRLTEDERVAIDAILEGRDHAFCLLVPDPSRQRYLTALVAQLRQLGITIRPHRSEVAP